MSRKKSGQWRVRHDHVTPAMALVAYKKHNNKAAAAREIGVSTRTLGRRLAAYNAPLQTSGGAAPVATAPPGPTPAATDGDH